MKERILILDADGTQTLPIAEVLYKNGYEVHGFYNHRLSYGYGCRYVSKKCLISFSEENYLQDILTYVKEQHIDVLFPMSDRTAAFLSKNKVQLEKFVAFISPDYASFSLGYDKNSLMHVCLENHVCHPRTMDLSNKETLVDESIFPALIKPNITTGGRGMTLVHSISEFNGRFPKIENQYGACHLQEFINSGGRQIKVQLFVDKNTQLICSSVQHKQRYYPENGGSSSCNETILNKDVVNSCYSVLKAIHWVGFADFDLIEDPKDGLFKIMEINPRMPACIKSSIKSGANYALLYVDYALGKPLKSFVSLPGYKLRHIGFEILWFIHSKSRFNSTPSWFKFWGRNMYYQDFAWNDPLPFFYGTIANIKKQLSPSFRKQKSGLR